ncbi:MAG TPA: hypothetical protein VFE58_13520 [Tepidisphaeraceae bacterium]|nr:hypothetical protein [Tepidisphaeraceae bacterium]
MGIRHALRENLGKATLGISAVVGILLVVITRELIGTTVAMPEKTAGIVFFTDDDGQTTFPDCAAKPSPFNHNGKEAVRAHMFRCGRVKFIGYLERYSKKSLASIEKTKHNPNFELPMLASIRQDVKKPKQGSWVSPNSTQGQKILDVKCPDGRSDQLDEVEP